jgi:hypothetical protein
MYTDTPENRKFLASPITTIPAPEKNMPRTVQSVLTLPCGCATTPEDFLPSTIGLFRNTADGHLLSCDQCPKQPTHFAIEEENIPNEGVGYLSRYGCDDHPLQKKEFKYLKTVHIGTFS